jgi:hypothetical protein
MNTFEHIAGVADAMHALLVKRADLVPHSAGSPKCCGCSLRQKAPVTGGALVGNGSNPIVAIDARLAARLAIGDPASGNF